MTQLVSNQSPRLANYNYLTTFPLPEFFPSVSSLSQLLVAVDDEARGPGVCELMKMILTNFSMLTGLS